MAALKTIATDLAIVRNALGDRPATELESLRAYVSLDRIEAALEEAWAETARAQEETRELKCELYDVRDTLAKRAGV